jgi:hypothetical protein
MFLSCSRICNLQEKTQEIPVKPGATNPERPKLHAPAHGPVIPDTDEPDPFVFSYSPQFVLFPSIVVPTSRGLSSNQGERYDNQISGQAC